MSALLRAVDEAGMLPKGVPAYSSLSAPVLSPRFEMYDLVALIAVVTLVGVHALRAFGKLIRAGHGALRRVVAGQGRRHRADHHNDDRAMDVAA